MEEKKRPLLPLCNKEWWVSRFEFFCLSEEDGELELPKDNFWKLRDLGSDSTLFQFTTLNFGLQEFDSGVGSTVGWV